MFHPITHVAVFPLRFTVVLHRGTCGEGSTSTSRGFSHGLYFIVSPSSKHQQIKVDASSVPCSIHVVSTDGVSAKNVVAQRVFIGTHTVATARMELAASTMIPGSLVRLMDKILHDPKDSKR